MSVYNNFVFIKGNLGKPAEVKETKAGTVARFSVAVHVNGKGQESTTSWETIVAWHDLARGVAKLDKGARLIIIGSVVTRSYEIEGSKRYVTEVQAREIGIDIGIAKDNDNESDPF